MNKSQKISVIVFPGTNCEHDTKYAFDMLGQDVELVWYEEETLPSDTYLVVIPGGFSYGDYLRAGSIAKFAPIMKDVIRFANSGGYVLGICNGFQVLLESGLLPGAMKRNQNVHFISKHHFLKVESNKNKFLSELENGDLLNIPIAHAEGNYYIDDKGLGSLIENGQVVLTYVDKNGNDLNPNGAVNNIAGISNVNKNVFGLMPHPERAMEEILGSSDGVKMLEGFIR
ncbi:MAG: Phosphoribosylformylglycinamidine synthase, glutamine amidotransferase subunit (EC [uncultured Campylobacterales bacterium]|uniref:Phosphoribosylformylglycinamidine synthase subunit PurQ n=1 Tax=uncultured Campylobacterales bacterium TaxID=352960 RepID=A0A6S6SQR1_9BACT|nr:MAG: Phosphoribosylformylglycinamidine synthase, glutamine amidotransferase subunit (EC [uncultured Campylobacterales bacterium]